MFSPRAISRLGGAFLAAILLLAASTADAPAETRSASGGLTGYVTGGGGVSSKSGFTLVGHVPVLDGAPIQGGRFGLSAFVLTDLERDVIFCNGFEG